MSEKTEEPTPKKLRDARKKGQVAKSKEVSSAAQLVAAFAVLAMFMEGHIDRIHEMMLAPTQFYEDDFLFAINSLFDRVFKTAFFIIAPVVVVVAGVAIASNLAQFGFLFSAEAISPKLEKINPASGIKKIFSLKNLVEFIKSAFKIAFLSILLFFLIRDDLSDLTRIPQCGLNCVSLMLGTMLLKLMLYTAAAFIIVAAIDFLYQKWQFNKEQRMTKDEVKKEYKESEGDPHIKGKRKQLHRELMESQAEDRVRDSKVVVTNPVHFAVALDYREGETPLPIIAAKGEGMRARRIKMIAEEEGIPVMENVPLARGLYQDGQVEQYIPTSLIEPVAEVLRYINELEERNS